MLNYFLRQIKIEWGGIIQAIHSQFGSFVLLFGILLKSILDFESFEIQLNFSHAKNSMIFVPFVSLINRWHSFLDTSLLQHINELSGTPKRPKNAQNQPTVL